MGRECWLLFFYVWYIYLYIYTYPKNQHVLCATAANEGPRLLLPVAAAADDDAGGFGGRRSSDFFLGFCFVWESEWGGVIGWVGGMAAGSGAAARLLFLGGFVLCGSQSGVG